jgi:hypothetical protein
VASGKPDSDLPDHDKATMRRLFALPMPDWADREAVADFAAARELHGETHRHRSGNAGSREAHLAEALSSRGATAGIPQLSQPALTPCYGVVSDPWYLAVPVPPANVPTSCRCSRSPRR